MTLASRLVDLVSAIGADIKNLQGRLTTVENGTGTTASTICVVNAATRLIQTQRALAQLVLTGQTP